MTGFASKLKNMFPKMVDVVSDPAMTAREASEIISSKVGGIDSKPSSSIWRGIFVMSPLERAPFETAYEVMKQVLGR